MGRILVVDDDPATNALFTEVLEAGGHLVDSAGDGVEALERLGHGPYDLVLLDVWMPRMNGLEVLARIREMPARPRVIVATSDDAPETFLRALAEQAHEYVAKPVAPAQVLERVNRALAAAGALPPIEVLSARPEWVELLVPCHREAAERIQSFLSRLEADLPEPVRESVATVFRELLLNAIEWGGRLDPSRQVRISCLRARRMLLYRIADPGEGFRLEDLTHAAVGNPPGDPAAHVVVREEKGIRSGGFGLLLARSLVDELIYNEKRNEVVFVKYLD